ncbi:MAG TPA: polyhydroxyalkanoic acid system family protein [Thermoanaerobaculia bacterium]|nr:polyhydroxyalkanoic acid system family protein [Thermoanaerobaculia bacterium]
MSDLTIEVATGKASMAELRAALDAAFQKEFPGGMLRRSWDGDVLRLSGPGAEGSITLEDGKLVGRAKLGPPASLMRAMIEQKVGSALRVAAG